MLNSSIYNKACISLLLWTILRRYSACAAIAYEIYYSEYINWIYITGEDNFSLNYYHAVFVSLGFKEGSHEHENSKQLL